MFFLITDEMVLCTPDSCAKSERTQDVNFFDLATNYELQSNLNLASCFFIKPVHNFPSEKKTNEKLHEYTATYLSAFKSDNKEREVVYNLLMTNPIIRILRLK